MLVGGEVEVQRVGAITATALDQTGDRCEAQEGEGVIHGRVTDPVFDAGECNAGDSTVSVAGHGPLRIGADDQQGVGATSAMEAQRHGEVASEGDGELVSAIATFDDDFAYTVETASLTTERDEAVGTNIERRTATDVDSPWDRCSGDADKVDDKHEVGIRADDRATRLGAVCLRCGDLEESAAADLHT